MNEHVNNLNIDASTFKDTANAVFLMNDTVREKFDDADHLQAFMESMAFQYMRESNSFSTCGFDLTAFDGSNGSRHIRASISSYLAKVYLQESIQDRRGKLVSLLNTYNEATAPCMPLTDKQHENNARIARNVEAELKRLGFTYGKDWREFSNGFRIAIDEG
jgi:hypothetical protein